MTAILASASGVLLVACAVFHRRATVLARRVEWFRSKEERAFTDSVTGLRNGHALDLDLKAALSRLAGTKPLVLASFSVDRDAALAEAGRALAESLPRRARAYHTGDGEFSVAASLDYANVREIVSRAARALSASGEVSYGVTLLPAEAA